MKTRLYYTFVVGTAIAMGNMRVPAVRHNQPAITAVTDTQTANPVQRALALLKPAADKLSAAKAFTFRTQSMVEVASPAGQIINHFYTSEIAVQRPNKLASRKTGDGPAFDLHYDGQSFSAVDQKLGLYAQMDAPGTLDELIPFVMDKTGIALPAAELLFSDVFGRLTGDVTQACWVDKSVVEGVLCDHLAFAAPGVEWQIWVGPEDDALPRRLIVTMLNLNRQPRSMVTFSEWKFPSGLPDAQFEFKKPEGAKQIEFRPLMADNKC